MGVYFNPDYAGNLKGYISIPDNDKLEAWIPAKFSGEIGGTFWSFYFRIKDSDIEDASRPNILNKRYLEGGGFRSGYHFSVHKQNDYWEPGKLRFRVSDNDTGEGISLFSTSIVTDDKWHYLALYFRRNSSSQCFARMTIDGVYQGQVWNNNGMYGCENPTPLLIGIDTGLAKDSWLKGYFAQLHIRRWSYNSTFDWINMRTRTGIYLMPDRTSQVFFPLWDNTGVDIKDLVGGLTGTFTGTTSKIEWKQEPIITMSGG